MRTLQIIADGLLECAVLFFFFSIAAGAIALAIT